MQRILVGCPACLFWSTTIPSRVTAAVRRIQTFCQNGTVQAIASQPKNRTRFQYHPNLGFWVSAFQSLKSGSGLTFCIAIDPPSGLEEILNLRLSLQLPLRSHIGLSLPKCPLSRYYNIIPKIYRANNEHQRCIAGMVIVIKAQEVQLAYYRKQLGRFHSSDIESRRKYK